MSTNKAQVLISASTIAGLMQSVHDILYDRFTSNGRTLTDNAWLNCNVYGLEQGFWKAVQDRDFGSVLTYSAMLAGRGVNVADLISDSLEAYSKQVETAMANLAEAKVSNEEQQQKVDQLQKVKTDLASTLAAIETKDDAIRLQRITIDQHEATIRDLRAKLMEKGFDPDDREAAALIGDAPYLSHEVEEHEEGVRTVISGDPQSVISLVLQLNEQLTVTTSQQPVFDRELIGEAARVAYEDVANLPKGSQFRSKGR